MFNLRSFTIVYLLLQLFRPVQATGGCCNLLLWFHWRLCILWEKCKAIFFFTQFLFWFAVSLFSLCSNPVWIGAVQHDLYITNEKHRYIHWVWWRPKNWRKMSSVRSEIPKKLLATRMHHLNHNFCVISCYYFCSFLYHQNYAEIK